MNDDLNNIFGGPDETGAGNPGEPQQEEIKDNEPEQKASGDTEGKADFSYAPDTQSFGGNSGETTSTYNFRPPVSEGEYHYGRAEQYSEPAQPEAEQPHSQDSSYRQNPYNNQYQNDPYRRSPFAEQENGSYQRGNQQAPGRNQGYNRNPYSNDQRYSSNGAQFTGENPYRNTNNGYPYYGASNGGYAYPDNPAPSKKKGGKIFVGILAAILVAVLGCVVFITVTGTRNASVPQNGGNESSGEIIDNVDEVVTASSPVADTAVSADGILTPTQIYEKVLPSSVGILVYSNSSKSLASEGSGVIISEDNDGKYTYIITCAHVISGVGQNIIVQLYNEKEYNAKVVGYDSRTDIGVVRIEESGLTAIQIGDSSNLSVGETIYAIGNPGGTEFANTFTNGIVTALDRPVASSSTGYTMECIQHNAAINPGNSGGALVNQYGQLIGINSMKIVSSEYEGMGFAVPSSVFVEVMNDLVVNGYVANRPKIGISYVKASSEQAYAMFVAIKGLPGGSIVIASVAEDSDFYGKLEVGDLVTSINGENLDSSADLAATIEGMKVGDKITLEVVRINSDYSFKEYTFTGVLVEDKETVEEEEESSTSYFDDYFGNSGGSSEDPYSDYFDDFFGNFFGNP